MCPGPPNPVPWPPRWRQGSPVTAQPARASVLAGRRLGRCVGARVAQKTSTRRVWTRPDEHGQPDCFLSVIFTEQTPGGSFSLTKLNRPARSDKDRLLPTLRDAHSLAGEGCRVNVLSRLVRCLCGTAAWLPLCWTD